MAPINRLGQNPFAAQMQPGRQNAFRRPGSDDNGGAASLAAVNGMSPQIAAPTTLTQGAGIQGAASARLGGVDFGKGLNGGDAIAALFANPTVGAPGQIGARSAPGFGGFNEGVGRKFDVTI